MKTEINTPVAILGFGVEGRSAYDFLKSLNVSDVTVCDENKDTEVPKGAAARLGKGAFEDLDQFKTIFRSPGVHYDLPGIKDARTAGARITSMTELTLEQGRERLTAITGSNGKTSTVAMLEQILRAHYKDKIIVGGNDRRPVLQEIINQPDLPILMEVSSFQFADIEMSPHISAILNITPNHLDWHENLKDYAHAKTNLIAHQEHTDWCVLNANDENSAKLGKKTPGKIFWLGSSEGETWVNWEDEKLVARLDGGKIEILNKDDLIVKTHPDNILCAVAISLLHGASSRLIKKELGEFKGAKHRLEFVREVKGLKFYNDSACTTPESAIVAINQFPEGNLILLMGGSSKNSEFGFLAHHIIETDTRVVLYGEEGPRIRKALEDENGEYLILHDDESDDFETVLKAAIEKAGPDYNIVLSPACASFDMFKNAKDRGEQFKKIVDAL